MRRLALALTTFALLLLSACAKFPANQNALLTKRLIFTVKMSGQVRTGQGIGQQPYIYIVALRLSTDPNPQDLGPIPVTSFGGNGFVAGHCTHFIAFNPGASNPYEIWQFRDDNLIDRLQTGVAINYLDPRGQGLPNTLQFEIDLSQLVPAVDVPTIQSIQANIFTMDKFALDASSHAWDGLGDGRIPSQDNTFLTFQLRNSRTITNTVTQLEPPDPDVRGSADPDLDIKDWSVEIRLAQ